MTPEEILKTVEEILNTRGKERDLASGERTIPKAVTAFNSLTGHTLSFEDGWIFMQILKLTRMREGNFKKDDYMDNVGYAVLLAEEAINTKDSFHGPTGALQVCPDNDDGKHVFERWAGFSSGGHCKCGATLTELATLNELG